ncbi:MAG: DUF1294 domain-containing protein [Clostridia bacterium]|nr:DUF1294 domain-containing protein [Clostridia bacterium]
MPEFNEIVGKVFTWQNIVIYLIVVNLFGFFIMWLDKRKAKHSKWRIKENTLFLVAAIGGGIGTIAGMYTFRHKTQKAKFVFGFPAIIVLQILIAIMMIFKI